MRIFSGWNTPVYHRVGFTDIPAIMVRPSFSELSRQIKNKKITFTNFFILSIFIFLRVEDIDVLFSKKSVTFSFLSGLPNLQVKFNKETTIENYSFSDKKRISSFCLL